MKEETVTQGDFSPLYGKPWKNEFVAQSFGKADEKRNNILKSGKVQVKVKRRGDGTFVVKTRELETNTPTKKSKTSKSKKKGE
tara:strand:- start:712 stop:960 length:249 start_codon:yes stop_codon:yes gene_type:complete